MLRELVDLLLALELRVRRQHGARQRLDRGGLLLSLVVRVLLRSVRLVRRTIDVSNDLRRFFRSDLWFVFVSVFIK